MRDTGAHQAAAQDQYRSDGDDRLVAEAGDRLLVPEDPGQRQREHDQKRNQIDAQLLGHEEDNRRDQDREDDEDRPAHRLSTLAYSTG